MGSYIELTDSLDTVQKRVNTAFAKEINSVIRKRKARAVTELKPLVSKWIMASPAIQSLLDYKQAYSLNATFGLRIRTSIPIVNAIVNAIASSTEIYFSKFSKTFVGTLELRVQPIDFANLLSLSEGHVYAIESNADLHWMDWLLKRGNDTIVVGYEYTPSGFGRSGGGTMTKGSVFRVGNQYNDFSGRETDNFVTRALSGKDKELGVIIERMFA